MFFLFDEIPGKIHNRPYNNKKEGHSEEIKIFSEDTNKDFKNRVVIRSVEEEEVCIQNFVDEENRNTFAKKKQKYLWKTLYARFKSAGKKQKRIHNKQNMDRV